MISGKTKIFCTVMLEKHMIEFASGKIGQKMCCDSVKGDLNFNSVYISLSIIFKLV